MQIHNVTFNDFFPIENIINDYFKNDITFINSIIFNLNTQKYKNTQILNLTSKQKEEIFSKKNS